MTNLTHEDIGDALKNVEPGSEGLENIKNLEAAKAFIKEEKKMAGEIESMAEEAIGDSKTVAPGEDFTKEEKILAGEAEPEEEDYTSNTYDMLSSLENETVTYLEGLGQEELLEPISQQEQQRAEEFLSYLDYISQYLEQSNNEVQKVTQEGALKSAEQKEVEEQADGKEVMKVLMRVAVRVGTTVAISIATNIAKNKGTPKEVKIALGIFVDLTKEGGKFAEKLVAGKENSTLTQDIVGFFTKGSSTNKAELGEQDQDQDQELDLGETTEEDKTLTENEASEEEKTILDELEKKMDETDDLDFQYLLLKHTILVYNQTRREQFPVNVPTFELIERTSRIKNGMAEYGLDVVCQLIAKIRREERQNTKLKDASNRAEEVLGIWRDQGITVEEVLEAELPLPIIEQIVPEDEKSGESIN